MEAYKEHFPKRNRIVSGIVDLVLVIEAEYRSGTSITAGYAKEQEKIVCCLPSNIDSKCSMGTNRLIQKGAKLIIKPREVIGLLENKDIYPPKKYNIVEKELQQGNIELEKQKTEKFKTKQNEKSNKTKVIQQGKTLVKDEKAKSKENIETKQEKREVPKEYEEIYNLITKNPIHINDICKISKKSIKEVTTILTMLEIEEYIEQIPGNRFKIK